MSLPGGEKYLPPSSSDLDSSKPWNHPLVLLANEKVRIEDVLNDHYGLNVPYGADRWKSRCPFAYEHADGGLDKQFRVFSTDNYGHCYESHGHLDPVRLWKMKSYAPTLLDAAKGLLEAYGIETKPKSLDERVADLQKQEEFHSDPSAVSQALQVFLSRLSGYEDRQYDDDVLRSVNSVLKAVPNVCAQAESQEEVERWFRNAKAELARLISR